MKNKKYLPIKIVQKRKKVDESLTEGGGGKDPVWMKDINHKEISEMFMATLDEVENEFNKRRSKGSFIPPVIELKLDKRTLAKSHRSYLREMVDVNRKNNFIGFQDGSSLIIKIDNIKDLKLIEENVSNVSQYKHGLSSIVKTKLFEPTINVEDSNMLKVKLLNFQDYDLNKSVQRAFEEMCKELALDIEGMAYTSDLMVYKIRYEERAFAELQEFEAISSIEDMPVFDVSFVSEIESDIEKVEMMTPVEGKSYPTVGVLDSGINPNKNLSPWLLNDVFAPYVDRDIDKGHGSSVASVLIYGDKLEGENFIAFEIRFSKT